jgi:hypothetical protein
MFSVWKTFFWNVTSSTNRVLCVIFFFWTRGMCIGNIPFNRQHTATGSGAKVLL